MDLKLQLKDNATEDMEGSESFENNVKSDNFLTTITDLIKTKNQLNSYS